MTESLAPRSWNVAVRAVGSEELEIAVYDVIGASFWGDGITSKDVLNKLRAAPKAKTINLRVNSVGGIVDEAKGMVNLFEERTSNGVNIVATVDGIAASAASYLLTAASKVIMPANAFQMIHGARSGRMGTAEDFEAAAALMRKYNDQLAAAYAAASARRGKGKTKEDFLAAFAAGDLYLDADEAIEWGLADEKRDAVKVAACLADIEGLANAPSALTSAPYVRAHAVATQTAPAPPPAAPETIAEPPRATGERKVNMTKEELKSQFPDVHAAILEEGKTSERKRVNAHLKLGTAYKAMDVAMKAIAEGKSSQDEEVAADYQVANVNRLEAAARQADSDAAGAVVAKAKAGKGAPEGAPGGAPVASSEDGEDSDLLVAAADLYTGKKA